MYEQALNIDTSLQNNTNLKQLDLQADYLKKALVVQKMSWYPTLTATDLYNWTSMSNGPIFKDFRWNPYSMIGLTLSIPIFQGGSRVRYDFYGCRNWRRLRDVAFYGYDSCLRIICVNVITLVIVPVVYCIFAKNGVLRKRRKLAAELKGLEKL